MTRFLLNQAFGNRFCGWLRAFAQGFEGFVNGVDVILILGLRICDGEAGDEWDDGFGDVFHGVWGYVGVICELELGSWVVIEPCTENGFGGE